MGLEAYQTVLKKEKISHDPAANELVSRVGARIAAATGRNDYRWEFKVIDDPKTVNAFCLPGGKVAVYTGLLPVARDEAGLAAVIGHEVAHVIANHAAERASYRFSRTPGRLERAAPCLGQDTGHVLREELGFTEEELQRAAEEGTFR